MGVHQQQQQRNNEKKRSWFSSRNVIISIVVVVTLLITTAWILSILNVVSSTLAAIITAIVTVAGVLFTFVAAFPSLFRSDTPKQTETHSSLPQLEQASGSILSSNPPAQRGIIGLPPPTKFRTIQPRAKDVQEIYTKLTQPDTTAVVLTGIGGVGKSTLAALVSEYAEEQLHNGKGPFEAEALWLRIDAAAEIGMADLMGNLMDALGKPLPNLSSLTPPNQAAAFFNALNTTEKARLVVLDQFETLLDWQTGHARADRPGVGELIDAFNSQPCRSRVLLTSRLLPKGTREYPPASMQEYPVKGLEIVEGVELLRIQGVPGTDDELRSAVTRCDGHALSLTLLASLLRSNQSLSLQALLTDPLYARLWIGGTGNIARNLLDYIYTQQLDDVQRQLLLAFSIYREPVQFAAVRQLVKFKGTVSDEKLLKALNVLLAQHLLQAMGALRYQLHSIVASYAHDHFDTRNRDANQKALRAAYAKAAQYYVEQAAKDCLPREERRRVSDVQLLVEATWQYCQAWQFEEAYNMMRKEEIFADLSRWGGNVILLELDRLLLPPEKWQAKPARAAFLYNNLGGVYDELGQKQEALRYYEQALAIRREVGDRGGEGTTLLNIGVLYFQQGRNDAALACFLLARDIFLEVLSPNRERVQQWIDDLHERVGEGEFVTSSERVEPHAALLVEKTLHEEL